MAEVEKVKDNLHGGYTQAAWAVSHYNPITILQQSYAYFAASTRHKFRGPGAWESICIHAGVPSERLSQAYTNSVKGLVRR